MTDPRGNATAIYYTAAGLIDHITDAQSNTTTFGYDARGNRTSVTDALSHQTTFTYNNMNRLTRVTNPDTTHTDFAYDNRGRRTSVTDANGKVTSYAYDDSDRLTSVTDAQTPTHGVTSYAYDTENNLLSITDASGRVTSFTYDALGRVTQTTFPSSLVETYTYDAVGNLTAKTDRKGQAISYSYDELDRLTHKGYPDSTGVDYSYDAGSRLTQVSDPTGTYQFTFDNMGRLTGTTTAYSFLTGRSFSNAYAYDAASNRTSFTDPESGVTSYVYDTLNRLTTLTLPAAISSGSFGFTYDALGRRTQMTRPNSVNTSYSYDNLSRLLSVLHTLNAATIDGATYTVDAVGNRTAKTNQLNAVTENYGYDAIYQLTSVLQGANTTETYTYDPVGNRLSSLGASPYSYNNSNQLTSTPTATYTYDNNGNTLTRTEGSNVTTYAWDFENRLASVTLPGSGGTLSFKYDPFGRRIQKSSAAGTTIYAYDGANIVEEVDSSGSAVARYAMGPRVDEPLAMLRGGVTSYNQADGLGSVTSLTDGSGSLAASYAYDSFGKLVASSGTVLNSLRYSGRELDGETGLYYYRARYYDSLAGKFLSEDPIGFGGGANFYKYAANSPVNFRDPSGLCTDPGGSGTRYCIEAFIPDARAYAVIPVGPAFITVWFSGDKRGSDSSGGTYRLHQYYSSAGSGCLTGMSVLHGKYQRPGVVNRCGTVPLMNDKCATKKSFRARAAASDGWFLGAAPNAAYDLTITETGTGVEVTGFATGYPSLEVWQYSDAAGPQLVYYHESKLGSFLGPASLLAPMKTLPPSDHR